MIIFIKRLRTKKSVNFSYIENCINPVEAAVSSFLFLLLLKTIPPVFFCIAKSNVDFSMNQCMIAG